MLHAVQHFYEKDKKSTMLPQAKLAFTWSNVRFECSPRNLCKLQELRGRCLDHEHHDMNEPRETTTAERYPAIPHVAGDIAFGRAEEAIF